LRRKRSSLWRSLSAQCERQRGGTAGGKSERPGFRAIGGSLRPGRDVGGAAEAALDEPHHARRSMQCCSYEDQQPARDTGPLLPLLRRSSAAETGATRSKRQTEWAVSSICAALAQHGEGGASHHDRASLRDRQPRMEFSIERSI